MQNYSISLALVLLVSAAAVSETAYQPDAEGFLRDWLVAGPFPSEPGDVTPEGYDQDFLTSIGREINAKPFAGLTIRDVLFPAEKGKLVARIGATNAWGYTQDRKIDVEWKELHWKGDSPIVKLDDVSREFSDHIVTYLCAYVYSSSARKAHVRLGTDDDFKLWINGKLVGQKSIGRGAKIDEDVLAVDLRKGMNRILLKVCERSSGTAAVLRFVDDQGKPMTDLKIALELPEHKYKAACKNIQRIDVSKKGLFAQIDFQGPPFFTGDTNLRIYLGYKNTRTTDVTIRLAAKGQKPLWVETKQVELKLDQAWEFQKRFPIAQPGVYVLTIQARGIGSIEKTFDVIGPEQLREEQKTLTAKRKELKRKLQEQSARLKRLRANLKKQKKAVAKQYQTMASLYAAHRQRKRQEYGPAARSIDKPFTPIPGLRATLCINGDLWEIAPAGKQAEKKIPAQGWESITVPTFGIEKYFRWRWWPVRREKEYRYAPGKEALIQEQACGFTINPGRENGAMFLRARFRLPKGWANRHVLFSTDRAEDTIRIWANDKLLHEGVYDWMIPLETDITEGLHAGENTLTIFAGVTQKTKKADTWGLWGDVYLKSVPDVYVEDCWVIPHWREATLETRTRITNTTKQPQKVILNQQAVLKERVRRDFGEMTVDIPPQKTVEIRQNKPWSDPELWDIGQPVLYQLVSTLRKEGKTVDQQFQRFGYREFWKSKFDYWLNGRRFFIQGNVCSNLPSPTRQYYTLYFTLLRNEGNINTIRAHTGFSQGLYADVCDELGMLFIPNMYPTLETPQKVSPELLKNFKKSQTHTENLRRYAGWVRWLRHHPSVVIYSTDNEVFTQAWPKPWDRFILKDSIAAWYETFVKSLDPSRLVTRDGDQGTWGKHGAWQQDPPADIANYHYPEFRDETFVHNWQSVFEKPVLYGETLYCSYGAWDDWIGAIPTQVAKKANRVRLFLGLYRDLDVSGWIGMGVGTDGFIELKPGGTPFDAMPKPATPAERIEWYRKGNVFPGTRLRWPARSGPGFKQEFGTIPNTCYGQTAINWYVPGFPVCVLNAVNQAYKESTRPAPQAPKTRAPEIIFQITRGGKPLAGAFVFLTPKSGQGTEPLGVWADGQGKAWFVLEQPGRYELTVDGTDYKKIVEINELPNESKAGLNYMPQLQVETESR